MFWEVLEILPSLEQVLVHSDSDKHFQYPPNTDIQHFVNYIKIILIIDVNLSLL